MSHHKLWIILLSAHHHHPSEQDKCINYIGSTHSAQLPGQYFMSNKLPSMLFCPWPIKTKALPACLPGLVILSPLVMVVGRHPLPFGYKMDACNVDVDVMGNLKKPSGAEGVIYPFEIGPRRHAPNPLQFVELSN